MSDFYITQFPSKDEPRGRDRDKKRRTRWQNNDPNFTSSLSAVPKYLPKGLTIEQQEALATRIRIEELTRKMNTSDLDMEFYKEREPSPEPIYDQHGKRTNTREHRAKDKLMEERQILVEVAYTMNPNFKPPADYTPAVIKKQRKIYIPIEKFPDYNFIGLIIGPRGNTQKRMEKETGCKIAIRGKGSIKEGKTKAIPEPGADDKLHVLITADNEVQLDKATKLIHELLVPVEEGKNEWKRAQLRELAEINGTLRDRWWMHPSESIQTWDKANVKCEICGDASHPTSDCTFKGKDVPLPAAQKEAMASEYEKFMQEISGDGGKAEEMYDEFMSSISGKPSQASDQSSLPPWQQQGFMAPWQQGAPPAPWAQPPAGGAPWAQAYPPGYAPPPGSGGPPPPWQQQQPPTQ